MSLQRRDDDERALARVSARAEIFSRGLGLKKELVGNPGAIAAIILSLQGEGLPVTLRNINGRFHVIEGQLVDSAAAVTAMAFRAGYRIDPVIRTSDLAVAAITSPDGHRIESEYTLRDAERAGHLDEWVEVWTKQGDRNKKLRWVVRRAGVTLDDPPWPDWVTREFDEGRVKRMDGWWKFPVDMLWKSAAVRAVRVAAPHVLLGDSGPGNNAASSPGPSDRGRPDVAEQDYIDVDPVEDEEPTHPEADLT